MREYTRVEFGLRLAYFDRPPAEVDWAAWSEALTSLSLVAEDEVITAANNLAKTIAMVGEQAHRGDQDGERWRHLQSQSADAQLVFVNSPWRGGCSYDYGHRPFDAKNVSKVRGARPVNSLTDEVTWDIVPEAMSA
ncbi:hypothetical protein ACIQNU_35150 [Streptomyces sp. NPDC091292]|uniref:hypothetical protein n=1 Tax=Streptomyces sp. NPDC091292 TaxID=3365991 RepID=UPI00380EA922